MEYFRTETGQIYADIAYRLGRIITQYEKLNLSEKEFEATLYIAVLQNLLTNCSEHTQGMMQSRIFLKDIESVDWGLKESCWVKNTYKEDRIMKNFIQRLRNAMSHPTEADLRNEGGCLSTGYTTLKDNSGIIKKFKFIDSPDIKSNRQMSFSDEEKVKAHIKRYKRTFPENIHYTERGSKYIVTLNSEPFIRISIIELSVEELASVVKNLANYLAQPIQKDWDGKTIKLLSAA